MCEDIKSSPNVNTLKKKAIMNAVDPEKSWIATKFAYWNQTV